MTDSWVNTNYSAYGLIFESVLMLELYETVDAGYLTTRSAPSGSAAAGLLSFLAGLNCMSGVIHWRSPAGTRKAIIRCVMAPFRGLQVRAGAVQR